MRFPFKDGDIIITENSIYSCPNTPNSDDNSCYIKEIDLRKLSELSFGDKKLVDVIRELLIKEEKLFENMDIVAIRTSIASSLIEEIKQAVPDAKIPDKLLSIAEADLTKCLALLSDRVIKFYTVQDIKFSEQDFEELSQLYDTNYQKFEALTSKAAAYTYKAGATFHELSDLYDTDKQKFYALISEEAVDAYLEGSATFEELSQVYDTNKQKFKVLTSLEAAGIYHSRGATFQELSQLYDADLDKFKALTSEAALFLYDKGIKFTDISALYASNSKKYNEVITDVNKVFHTENIDVDELIERVNKILLEEKNKPKEKRKFTDDIKDHRQEALNKPKISNKRTYAESLQEQRQEEIVKIKNTKGV